MIPSARDLVAKALECDPASLNGDSGLARHPAWDSVGHLSVMMALEQHYGVEITDRTIIQYETMAAIIARHDALAG